MGAFKRDIRLISLAFLFIGMLVMSMFVTNAGDDFFYASFSNGSFSDFLAAHADHYIHTNGRCIVHVLASVFLWLPHIIWKIVNALMWTATALNIYKLVNLYVKDTSKLRFFMFMLCGGILTIHIEMAKESTLWLTGSFNYTYPLMMFTWYWYLLFTNEKHSTKKLCIIGFLAAASMEQESVLAVLLTLGFVYVCFKSRGRLSDKLKKTMIITAVGAATLLLAPGNLTRMGDEIGSSAGTLSNIFGGIDFMLNYCISSDYMIWLNIVFMTCCALYLYKSGVKTAAYLLPLEIAALLITNHSGEFEWLGFGYSIIFALSRIYYFAAAGVMSYAYLVRAKNPLIMMGLGFGFVSCAFVVFSPTLGARVVLFAEVMTIMSAAMILAELLKKNTWTCAAVHLLVLALSVWNISYITHGFYKNSVMYDENVRLIEEWCKTQHGELVQKQYRNDAFEHSMPYNSSYHEGRYKEFFGIPSEIRILWE